ncbi:hypothetical protein Tco_0144596 [Tanacetum coccineum]
MVLEKDFAGFTLQEMESSIDAPNSNSFNDPPNVFTHPPQPQYESYSCELCGNDAHYGYDCPLRVPLIYEHEPGYDNYYPQNSLSFPQQYLNCEKCGGPHKDYQCQSWHQNYSEPNPCYNSNSYGFDQPMQYSIDHQPQSIQEDLNPQRMNDVPKAIKSLVEKLCQQEQAANVSTQTPEPSRRFNSFYDDDDYEESTIPLNEINSQTPASFAITHVLPIEDSKDSLIMRDENLSTIPEKESNKIIKSSVEDLVPIPSESEDTSGSDEECDLPFCDNSVTFSNPLFKDNDDFTSSDDESLLKEDVQEENFKIYSNRLFEFDDEYISSDVNPFFNEVLEDIESEDSYVSKLDEPDLLVTPLSKLNEDECFDPGGDVDEIELLLHRDPSTPKISVASILEGFTDEPPLEENDDLFDLESKENEWKKILYDAPIDDLMTEDKVFDPGIHEKTFSPTYVSLPFEDRHYLSLTYVIRIFLPYFTYLVESSLPLSSGSEDGISAFHFYSLEPVASHRSGTFMCFNVYPNILNESPMEICSSTRFNPNITMIWGESS